MTRRWIKLANSQKIKIEPENLIHYELIGRGPKTVLLINGLARSSSHWLNFKDELLGQGYQLLLVDNRGFGKSKDLIIPWNAKVELFAQDIVNVMNECSVKQVHAVGLSLGGMIALQLAGQFPDRVTSMSIINSSAANTHPLRMSTKGIRKLLKMGFKKTAEARTKIELDALTSLEPDSARYMEIFKHFVAIEKAEPVNPKNVALQFGAALQFSLKDLRRYIHQPCVIIYADNDQFVPNQNSLGLQKNLPHAVVRCISGAGHELMVEKPSELVGIINDQLAINAK